MAKTFRELRAAKVDRFVASLTEESEFFGLLGAGYPGSFYKVFVRPTKASKAWWRFEVEAGQTNTNPIKSQGELKVSARAAAVWAPLPLLADFTHHPEKPAIAKLLARAKELRDGNG